MNKEILTNCLYKKIGLPLTRQNCERTHNSVFSGLEKLQKSDSFLEILKKEFNLEEKGWRNLRVNALGIEFPNPFLLAAGMDKDARVLPALACFSVGGIEAGSFTFQSREGNPLVREEILPSGRVMKVKRMQRFPDGTVINWMGFPGVGTAKAVENLNKNRKKVGVPVGVNLAVSPGLMDDEEKMKDLRHSLELVYPAKPEWLTLNVSCPNVTETARNKKMKEAEMLITFFAEISDELDRQFGFRIPKLIKIGPDMEREEIGRIVERAKLFNCDGIVATNTTVDRTGIREKYAHIQQGGLSGPRLFEKSLRTVHDVSVFNHMGGKKLVVIACGGIDNIGKWRKMQGYGADLCQILTGFVFGGPYFFKKMCRDNLNPWTH